MDIIKAYNYFKLYASTRMHACMVVYIKMGTADVVCMHNYSSKESFTILCKHNKKSTLFTLPQSVLRGNVDVT